MYGKKRIGCYCSTQRKGRQPTGVAKPILLDKHMPVMSGIEFLTEFEKEGLKIDLSNLIFISNSIRSSEIEELNRLGVERMIQKPINLQNLKMHLEEMNYRVY